MGLESYGSDVLSGHILQSDRKFYFMFKKSHHEFWKVLEAGPREVDREWDDTECNTNSRCLGSPQELTVIR